MNQSESLAELLTRLRQEAGLSLRQLERASGVARDKISRLERGEYRRSEPATLNRLAQSLGAEASELLTVAGIVATQAEALPSIRPYLRTKYGHLSATAQTELAAFLDHLEAEQSHSSKKAKQD